MERQTNLDQADRSLPNPNDSRRAPVCFDGTGKIDQYLIICLLFPREDQRSTRTDVTKLTRNRMEFLANPPAQVSILSTCRMTDRHSAIGRLLRRTFPQQESCSGGEIQPRAKSK